jgi:hypothetical protein
VLEEVKAKRPSVTILLAHEGGFCEQACSGEIFDLAKALPAGSVDLIVAGHTHVKLATEANGIPIVEAQSSGTAIGVTDLVRRADGGVRGYIDVRTTWADQVTPDSALGELTYQLKKQVGPLAGRQIATLAQPLDREHEDGEYPLGTFIADAQRNLMRADVAVMNNGGIRASLPSGAVTYENIFAVQPFGNQIVVLFLNGKELREVLEHALETGIPTAHVSGITVTLGQYPRPRPAHYRDHLPEGEEGEGRRDLPCCGQRFPRRRRQRLHHAHRQAATAGDDGRHSGARVLPQAHGAAGARPGHRGLRAEEEVTMRLFVNEKPVDVIEPATVADAVTAFDAALGAALLAGTARATDARGIDIAPNEPVGPGSIVRILGPSRPDARS